MNNYYILIYLTEQLNNKLQNAVYRFGISPHRHVWEGYFEHPADDISEDGDRDRMSRLIFSSAPTETALFTDSWRPPKKSNVLRFFESLEGETVQKITLAENDRLLTIHLSGSGNLLVQPFGHRANIFHVTGSEVTDAFREPAAVTGRRAPQPRPQKPATIPPEDPDPKRMLLATDAKFPRHLVQPVIREFKLEQAEPEQIFRVTRKLVDAMKSRPEFRVLESGHPCLIPADLLPLPELKRFGNANETIRYCYYRASRLRRFSRKKQQLVERLERLLRGTRSSLSQLEDAEKALERAEQHEEAGHLLMAQAHRQLDPTADSIEVQDFYHGNRPRRISLEPGVSVAANAERYYEKAHGARRRVEESARREKEIRLRIVALEELLESLDPVRSLRDLENWQKQNEEELRKMGMGHQASGQRVSLPWRRYELGGYEIRIGKNARSNDEVTSSAHKEDIWLHARGTGGSHVVIRMENSSGHPPREVLLRAAAWAAWHSGLRGSSLVPVIVTKRKYVTKPKGAPAGSVRVEREEVEMVKPEEPDRS